MILYADQHITELEHYLNPDITCYTYDSVTGPQKEILKKADALLVRTVTRIDRELIDQAPRLQFAGTASAGSDHVDKTMLQERGIGFASSPGCNARAVAGYVATGILLWSHRHNLPISSLKAGIVGMGNAGTQVRNLLERLGLETAGYDPPRQRTDPGFQSAGLEEILSCDIISLHVPLIRTGGDATVSWLDEHKIQSSAAQLFINSARGGVADEQALLKVRRERNIDFILDVWNNEPVFDDKIADAAFMATPHIAGYSIQAKQKATSIVCEALHDHFKLDMPSVQTGAGKKFLDIHHDRSAEEVLREVHPTLFYHDQLKLRYGLPDDEKKLQFAKLRNDIPLRDEFEFLRVPGPLIKKYPFLNNLGITA